MWGKKLHKWCKKFIFWSITLFSLTAITLGFACSFFLMSLLVSLLIFLGLPDSWGWWGWWGSYWQRPGSSSRSTQTIWAVTDGTEWHFSPPELHCSPLGTILDIFPDTVRTLAILLLAWKCERFYFIETAARWTVFVLGWWIFVPRTLHACCFSSHLEQTCI